MRNYLCISQRCEKWLIFIRFYLRITGISDSWCNERIGKLINQQYCARELSWENPRTAFLDNRATAQMTPNPRALETLLSAQIAFEAEEFQLRHQRPVIVTTLQVSISEIHWLPWGKIFFETSKSVYQLQKAVWISELPFAGNFWVPWRPSPRTSITQPSKLNIFSIAREF